MNGTDLFGDPIPKEPIPLLVFHDERRVNNLWLYHSFLFIQETEVKNIIESLKKKREQFGWQKELKFKSLNNTNDENNLAVAWIEEVLSLLGNPENKIICYYFFGVDYQKLEQKIWKESKTRDSKIYNKFFQIGLYGGIKWFFGESCKIKQVFSDKKDRPATDKFSTQSIKKIKPKIIEKKEDIHFFYNDIIPINSDHEKEKNYPNYSHLIQLVDLLTGGFSQIFDFTSKAKGKCKVADTIISDRLLLEIIKCNKKSRNNPFYKRVCISFFPREKLKKDEILDKTVKKDQFYKKRKLNYLTRNQLTLFD